MEILGTSIIPIDQHNRVLLQLRDDKDWILYPNQWGFFGGHIEEGETTEECAIREFKEETGISAERLEFLTKHVLMGKEVHVYVTKVESDKDEIEVFEGQKGKFFNKEEIKELDIIPWQAELLKTF